MDILGMLQNDMDELCEEDIEMIQEELDVGDYTYEYKQQCRLHILKLTHYFEQKKKEKVYQGPQELTSRLFQKEEDVVVVTTTSEEKGEVVEATPKREKTKLEAFREEIQKMRSMSEPEKRFAEYVDGNEFITNEFIDQNMNEFNELERNALLRRRQFSEEFLDKYFDVLDHGTLALNQLYSEEFFMKHYAQLPVKVVLTRSKNPWRQKAKRSKKLDSFLRLKGVKI